MDQFKGDGSSEDIHNFDENFNDIFIQISESIESMVQKNKAEQALEVLNSFVITANLYAQINNNILNKLSNITGKLKALLESIAKKLQAASYSISISAPAGIAIGITWNV